MKKFILTLVVVACGAMSAVASNPLSALQGLLGNSSNSSSSTSTGSTALDALTGIVSGLISNKDVSTSDMVGTWSYSSPAVSFQSENLLQQAGGSAASSVIEKKLATYYKKFKLTNLKLVVNSDQTFTMSSGKITTSGTIEKGSTSGTIVFHFTAASTFNIGQMTAYVTMSGSTMSLMFDVSKLQSLVSTVSSVSGNSTLSTMSSLLSSYDGICAGFKLKKK